MISDKCVLVESDALKICKAILMADITMFFSLLINADIVNSFIYLLTYLLTYTAMFNVQFTVVQ